MNLKTFKYRSKFLALLMFLIVVTGISIWGDNLELHIIDVAQGDCQLIVSPTGKTLLIDAGNRGKGNNTVFPYLDNLGISSLDYTVASHYDADHIGGMDEVIQKLGGSTYILSAAYDRGGAHKDNTVSFQDYVQAVSSKRTTITPGTIIDLGGGVTLTCIAAGGKTASGTIYSGDDENLLSIVLRLDYYDFQVYLGGDSEDIIEQVTGGLVGDVDIQKVSHHGSDDASKQPFLDVIRPEVSTISVGNNGYGHPADAVYQRLYASGSYIYQTEAGDDDKVPPAGYGEVANGSFVIKSNGCSYTVSGAGLQTSTYNTDNSCDCCNGAYIVLNRTELFFGAGAGTETSGQTFSINNTGSGLLQWSITGSDDWLDFTPDSGVNAGQVTVSVDSSALIPGIYSGTVTISVPGAVNSPQEMAVTLKVYESTSLSVPFGDFSTPVQGAVVSSSVPVTGWVLDDIEVVNVKIYNGNNYLGDAVFVEGARPDLEQAFPGYPNNYQAGWGYMMLTHFLPNGGNGSYTISAKAMDAEGNQVILGSKTIGVDNVNAVKPFGAIDTPSQGGMASGNTFINWGWVLTPQHNNIPTDGNTIKVYVDGVYLGHPNYNIYRSDIASFFPGYANSNGAAGFFTIDTTSYDNGVHTIQWTATDSSGNTDGIGSRYFSIQNSGTNRNLAQKSSRVYTNFRNPIDNDRHSRDAALLYRQSSTESRISTNEPIRIIKGFTQHSKPQTIYSGETGIYSVQIKELERLEVHLENPNENNPVSKKYEGYQWTGNRLKALPIGSMLDIEKGIFYWQPGVGFYGRYRLIFVSRSNPDIARRLQVDIGPKKN